MASWIKIELGKQFWVKTTPPHIPITSVIKNETCDVYEKIQVGWEARKLGSKEAGSSEKKIIFYRQKKMEQKCFLHTFQRI